MTDIVRGKGITDEKVLDIINKIPRHIFLDSAFDEKAYEDIAFPIGEGQTISQPYTVAYQSQLLELKPFQKVLEIGTGSAYQAVVLAELGAQVYTIERQKQLFERNKEFFLPKKYLSISNSFMAMALKVFLLMRLLIGYLLLLLRRRFRKN